MAKPQPKPASQDKPVKIGDKRLVLRFSLRAMLALRDKWGYADDDPDTDGAQTADEKVIARLTNPSFTDFVTIMWAASRTHHPELTEEDLVELMDEGGLEGLKSTLDSVIRAGAPPEPTKSDPPKAAAKKTR